MLVRVVGRASIAFFVIGDWVDLQVAALVEPARCFDRDNLGVAGASGFNAARVHGKRVVLIRLWWVNRVGRQDVSEVD